ncbi:MAG: methionine adenosyltransferase [Bacillota bacterium]|nr:methionine adenosyltransferase [Bacillota bacterium]
MLKEAPGTFQNVVINPTAPAAGSARPIAAGHWLFTSESVTEGHPDKVCDQISDAVLDEILRLDPLARVACETIVNTGMVLVMGEISTSCYVDIPRIARGILVDIGYNQADYGFDGRNCAVLTAISEQSGDISGGVSTSLEARKGEAGQDAQTGAGDQGMMFGYACDDTPELMPLPLALAHRLCRRLAAVRKSGLLPSLRPDGKAQVTVEYGSAGPVRIHTVVVSTQHDPDYNTAALERDIFREVVLETLPADLVDGDTVVYINPSGKFVLGGPQADSGLSGRKIIVDTYGGMAAHGGGSFSGKDPTKVDRSASYVARYIARHIVAGGYARRCQVQLAYAISVAHPVSVLIDTQGTGTVSEERLTRAVEAVFPLTPDAIIRELELRSTRYRPVAAYGHFGRPDLDLPWERLDRLELLAARLAADSDA